MDCKWHAREEYESQNYIVNSALGILRRAERNIIERDKGYNGNGVGFEDYRVFGVKSCVEQILENIVRLYNSGSADKAEDSTAFTALMAAFIQEGQPQSIFNPLIVRLLPELQKGIKAEDVRTGEIVDSQPYQPKAV